MMATQWLKGCVVFMLSLASEGVRRHAVRGSKANGTTSSNSLVSMYPFFHTTSDIQHELKQLAAHCPGMSLRTESRGSLLSAGSTDIDVITIKSKSSTPHNRMFMLFGEHARELISPETGLHFIKTLCGETDLSSRAQNALADTEFQIVVNGNPRSRMKVEEGEYCLRVNPNGVDLNRNWNEAWDPKPSEINAVDTNPGPAPFSEAETQIFKKLVTDFDPTVFLTIHSGTKGMYMPWAYDMEHLAARNEPQMMEILEEVDKDHCQCPFGAAGREVGYSCPGTCLDWVYDKLKTPYAFAFEIYTGPEEAVMLRQRWEEKIGDETGVLLQQNSHLGHTHFRRVFEEHPSSFVQLRSQKKHRWDRPAQECFDQFNPGNEKDFKEVLDNWSGAYLAVAAKVTSRLSGVSARSANATV